MQRLLLLIISLFSISYIQAQQETAYGSASDHSLPQWVRLMYAENPNIDSVSIAFEHYYNSHPFEKNAHTQYFKRWLRDIETYDYQFRNPNISIQERNALKTQERAYQQQLSAQSRAGNWTAIGPIDWDHTAAGRSYAPGAAHVYTIEQCSNDSDILYAGTATAGLWRSSNHGATWTNINKDLISNTVYAIEINPNNCNEIYAAMLSGIYKSTNGGTSWTATGDASFQALNLSVKDIKFSPNGSTLWAATNEGLYRSNNGGNSWTQVLTELIQEIEFHPSNSNTIYIIRQLSNHTEFYKSTNGGNTFNIQTNGWPSPTDPDHNRRAEIAVSPDAPNKVYALLTGSVNGGSGLYGFYVSNDAGASWTFSCCGPQPGGPPSTSNINTMAWSDAGTDDGGQYYYDVGLAVSPTDADKIFIAGVNLWVSDDGGNTFSCPAKWSHPHKANYVHADIHDVNYYNTGDIWLACDGGIFHSTDDGASFDRSIEGISGSDFWGFGMGYNNEELMVGGAYHNGTLLKNGDVYENDWVCMDGGDGVGGAVHPIFENQLYSDRNIKTMPDDRTVAPSTRSYALEPSWHYTTGRFSQIEFDAHNYNVHYFGSGNSLYKTEDDNRTVSLIYDFGALVSDVEVAWTNDQVIYVTTWPGHWDTKHVYKSTNGGISWTEITPSTSVFSNRRHIPYDIEVSYEDENVIWLARIGRQSHDNKKIFRSDNGGSSWTNITTNSLDGEVPTNIIAQRGNDHLYLGTTRAVYHNNTGHANWQLFNDGLPASIRSRQLAIGYRSGTLVNASNRSVWASPIANHSVKAQISVDKTYSGCARDTFKFADYSTVSRTGTSYQWSFPGAQWVSSTTSANPEVVFGETGNFSVSLSVNASNGSHSQTLTNLINIGDECSPSSKAGTALSSSGSNHHFRSDHDLDFSSNTLTLSCWLKPDGIQDDYTGLIFNDGTSAGLNLRSNNEVGYHWSGGGTHWGWSSGLSIPADEWSFVSIVFSPNKITLHVNDQKVERNLSTSLAPVYWERFRVGSYKGWGSRNFRGDIDEVCIWNRALSTEEIRELRHLTKYLQATPSNPLFDSSMKAYLQFNDTGNKIYDRVGSNHGYLNGSASLVASTAPVGDGSSSRIDINTAGTYNFSDEKLRLSFDNTGSFVNDDIVVTRLSSSPPNGFHDDVFSTDHYWIINNYGNNNFSNLSSIRFSGLQGVGSSYENNPQQFLLYKRPSNAFSSEWGNYIDQATQVQAGGTITFDTDNITSFSQFSIGFDASILPLDFHNFWLSSEDQKTVQLHWQTSLEKDVKHFAIQRSTNGNLFETIAYVDALNNNTNTLNDYKYTDQQPYRGRSYYRIKAIDYNGDFQHSKIKDILLDSHSKQALAYPNPIGADGGIHLMADSDEQAVFRLYDEQGRLIRQTSFFNWAFIRIPSLPSATYNYSISVGTKVLEQGQLLKL